MIIVDLQQCKEAFECALKNMLALCENWEHTLAEMPDSSPPEVRDVAGKCIEELRESIKDMRERISFIDQRIQGEV